MNFNVVEWLYYFVSCLVFLYGGFKLGRNSYRIRLMEMLNRRGPVAVINDLFGPDHTPLDAATFVKVILDYAQKNKEKNNDDNNNNDVH